MVKIGQPSPLTFDPFADATWAPGAIERTLANPPAAAPKGAAGRFSSAYTREELSKYIDTLGGKPTSSYDPEGFLEKTLGLTKVETAGRGDVELLKAFRLIHGYTPDPGYLPGPSWLASAVQKGLIGLNHMSARPVGEVDKLFTHFGVERLERPDTLDPNPYGRVEDVIKGERTEVTPRERYAGLVRAGANQLAWGQGVHGGSIMPERGEAFGTFDIAKRLGFSEAQARRIAEADVAVDTGATHYRDPDDPSKPRKTMAGSGGKNGDLHWHFNRSPEGVEDSRISAARVHLERAAAFARDRYYDAAEREIGIGLHSVQDMFAHAQITPFNHGLLGDFPDFVKCSPVGMLETTLATEGYLKAFVRELDLKPSREAAVKAQLDAANGVVVGNAPEAERAAVMKVLARYPRGLSDFLTHNGIRIYVGAPGTKLTELGFGADLDGDGSITPGKWVDVNHDGVRDPGEVEDELADGRRWDEQLGAYDHGQKLIFVSAALPLEKRDEVLRHEIRHAVDLTFADDPHLCAHWSTYLSRLFEQARRNGDVDIMGEDAHELFAG